MPKLHFGWFTPPLGIEESGDVPLAIWQQSEILPVVAQHFDSLWLPDHLYGFTSTSSPSLECWTTLTWLAARFPAMRVGPVVLAVGYRNPALLAKMAATLHALSGGRVIVGIGGGWREEEFRAYGYDFPRPATRIKQLEEAVQIIRLMWAGSAPTFRGEYFHIQNAYCYPQPTPPPPIMIGGGGEKLLIPLAARLADIWDLYHGETYDTIDLAAYRRKRDLLRQHAQAAGRDPASPAQSLTIGQARLPASSESSRRWLDQLRSLVELGVTQFILDCGHVTTPDVIRRFAEEVMAPLKEMSYVN